MSNFCVPVIGHSVKRQSGFTLIEVMIALLIVGVGVVAVIDAANNYTNSQAELEKKLLADWVASNALETLRHESKTSRLKSGSERDTVDMGGYSWRINIKKQNTDVEKVYMVIVEVSLSGDIDKRVVSQFTTAMTESR